MNGFKTAVLLGLLTGIILYLGSRFGGMGGLAIALGFSILFNFGMYWFSDRLVLAMHGAKEIGPDEDPALHGMVSQLAMSAGIPKPKIYFVDSEAPNAFATGRDPAHGKVAVTAGLLQIMNESELRGVLAHELAHIKNRDILISTVAATLAGIISSVARIAHWGLILGGGSRDRDDDGGGLGDILLLIMAPILAFLIQLWVSRTREYAADSTGARVAGSPTGLANALLKLQKASEIVPMHGNPATAHLYIMSPLSGRSLLRFLSTHPPIEERVRRLLNPR